MRLLVFLLLGLAARTVLVVALAVVWAIRLVWRHLRPSDAHGSAVFLRPSRVMRCGMIALGSYRGTLIHAPEPAHVLCVAPTGSGKTSSLVLPNLLSIDAAASCLVTDPKGECALLSATHRAQFGPVYRWAPLQPGAQRFNPLDCVRYDTDDALTDAQLVAQLMVPHVGDGDPFWTNEARNLLTGIILFVLHEQPPELRTLGEVRALLTNSPEGFEHMLTRMTASRHDLVQSAAHRLRQKSPNERSGVISSAQAATAIWDSPRLQAATACSDFAIGDLKRQISTLYIIIPPEKLATFAPALRLIVGLGVAALSQTRGPCKVVCLLDEFANLGPLPSIESAISIARSAGLRLCLFVQDIAQLKRTYPRSWQTFFANCTAKVFFGVADIEEAERLSRTLGKQTISTRQHGISGDATGLVLLDRRSASKGETGRALLTPDEILTLPQRQALVLLQGQRPMRLTQLYFRARPFRQRLPKPAPVHADDLPAAA